MIQTNRRLPVTIAQMAAREMIVVFPLPRGKATALMRPRVAARSRSLIRLS